MTLSTLLVEDDQDLADSICEYLRLKSVSVEHANNGPEGLRLASTNHYDVLLLDLMLPGLDGLSLCRELRSQGIKTPVLMLTARDTLDDKVAGFTAGSDDYLVKPFALEELTVRVHSLARWHSGQIRTLEVGDLRLDLDNQQAWRQQQPLKLSLPVLSCWKF
ncbi:response regulator transcription factor [Aliamphritea spongicola]